MAEKQITVKLLRDGQVRQTEKSVAQFCTAGTIIKICPKCYSEKWMEKIEEKDAEAEAEEAS